MFSPRYLAILAFVAAASSLPTQEEPINSTTSNETDLNSSSSNQDDDDSWLSLFFFGDFLAPLLEQLPNFEDLTLKNIRDGKFQVILQVQDFEKDELKVKINGNFLSVEGLHVVTENGGNVIYNKFTNTYTLPANASASDVTANLTSDGCLIITAPINGPVDRTLETEREVPIVETGTIYNKEETPGFTALESSTFSEGGQNEPLIPLEQKGKSEKDNEIISN